MTADFPPPIDRLYDLLADRATQGLTPAEAAELAALQARWPHVEDDYLDLAAAAAALTFGPPPDALPAALRDAILRNAPNHLPAPVLLRSADRHRSGWRAAAGWVVAAGLAGVLIWSRWPTPVPTPAERFAALGAAPGTARFAGQAAAGPGGEVVWNAGRQQGYLQIRGLPPNDPARTQYQLWIVDGKRPDPQPVDGGVFDVRPDGSAVVPVRAALPVFDARAFAVTAEPPGGVVVSKGPHLLVLAPAGG